MTAETIRLPQDRETPVTGQQRRKFGYRYAYARSADSRANNDPGQDFLCLREDGQRLVFALCDGVSQSFYGDLAARLLGEALVDWLWDKAPSDPAALPSALEAFLDSLVVSAGRQVEAHPLPDDLPPMVRQVLEQKRALGSETTFAAGRLDLSRGRLDLAWMGDSRLRLWGHEGEITARLGETFHTQERWSTRRGRIGSLHTFTLSTRDLRYLMAYSDGLAILDKILSRHFRAASIEAIIADSLRRPESDDISFLEIWLGDRPPSERPPLAVPQEARLVLEDGRAVLRWRPVAGAARYEIWLENGPSFSRYAPGTSFELPREALTAETRRVRVRAWDEEPGEWSAAVPLPEGLLPTPPQPQVQTPPPGPEPAAPVPVPVTPPPAPSPAPSSRPAPPLRPRPSPWRLPAAQLSLAVVLLCCGTLGLLSVLLPASPVHRALFPTHTATPTSTPTITPTSTSTATPTSTPTATLTPTPTATPTPTPTATLTPTPTATPTPTPTATPTPTPTATPTPTPTSTSTATSTPTLTSTSTATPMPTESSASRRFDKSQKLMIIMPGLVAPHELNSSPEPFG